MNFNIITAFPNFYDSFLETSLIKKAVDKKVLNFNTVDIKNFGIGKYRQIDDRPYGGGAGMIQKVDVTYNALQSIKEKGRVIALSPKGKIFTQKDAIRLSKINTITLISSRYEGLDDRVYNFCDETISIGNYITMGGDAVALVLIESISRLISGVIQNNESTQNESFTKNNEIEYPQYTKPYEFEGLKVPEILLSGNHGEIAKWRVSQATRNKQQVTNK